MLAARRLTKRYGSNGGGAVALDALDLEVGKGEVFCLLGANGAGKTTTIHLFVGFFAPTSGEAWIDGLEVAREPLLTKRRIAYLPEQVMLYGNLSGRENLSYFAALGGRPKLSREELDGLLRRAGLPEGAAGRRVSTYSKGMRQKVGIAIAIAKRAKVLLLDEPTSGLDPEAANELSQLIVGIASEGVAVLMATHDLFRAKEIGSRLGIMKKGRLVATVAAADIGHAELETLYLEHMRG